MRPWNPAYREVWDAMTPRERRITVIIDWIIVLVVIVGCAFLNWWFEGIVVHWVPA